MTTTFGPRRAIWIEQDRAAPALPAAEAEALAALDELYRSLCAMLYNYVPMSGHPGGSISSGRLVAGLLFGALDHDLSRPDRPDADLVSYAAGHKAMGLYALWALRDEVARLGAPELLPADEARRLRLEDLLGFRRNPTTATPLFRSLRAKALDGHPSPATPFVRLATGASGVGLASSLGLALGALDAYGAAAPRVHVIEGEGGLTPGRVAEALAFAGTAGLHNAVVHLDWNQASIDSERVTREGATPGDYVQWTPAELFHLHDWNVVEVGDGLDLAAVAAAQRRALALDNGQPTAIIYRTRKGWQYGVEGRASHGAGHKLCSPGFYAALKPAVRDSRLAMPVCEPGASRCGGGKDAVEVEACFWQSLTLVRGLLEANRPVVETLAARLRESRRRLDGRGRALRAGAGALEKVFQAARASGEPEGLELQPGAETTLRGQLGKALDHLNRASGGAVLVAAADLLGSTSVGDAARGFPPGFFQARTNPAARTLSVGGICEDAMAGVLSGLAAFGHHLGVASSYGAFLAPPRAPAARLHAIGCQAREAAAGEPYRPMILICAHAGLKTGEDGPTHADPQPLQLLQENFPARTVITLTPWEPREIWPLLAAALTARPAVIAPFVTRPSERVPDRAALGLAPAAAAAQGLYQLRAARGVPDATVLLQESGVVYAFVEQALPLLEQAGLDVEVFLVTSAELFDAQPESLRQQVFPERKAQLAMGITGFTQATLHRWIRSDLGRAHSLHPFQHGRFLGSGPGAAVLLEAGLDGRSQFRAVARYVEALRARAPRGDPAGPELARA